MNIEKICLLFFIYSFLGWIIEVILKSFSEKKFINRGFLIGPYLPIYGCGGVLATIFLTKYKDNIFVTFIMSIFLFAILEYFTSYIMEKLFHARWWDYSKNKFNINGRICLETLIPFGLLGCVVIYFTNPLIEKLIINANETIFDIILFIVSVCFIFDFIISLNIINSFKNTTIKFIKKDNTEEITRKVKEVLLKKSYFTKRLIESFSKLKIVLDDNIDIKKTKLKLKETKKKVRLKEKEIKKTNNKIKKLEHELERRR